MPEPTIAELRAKRDGFWREHSKNGNVRTLEAIATQLGELNEEGNYAFKYGKDTVLEHNPNRGFTKVTSGGATVLHRENNVQPYIAPGDWLTSLVKAKGDEAVKKAQAVKEAPERERLKALLEVKEGGAS